jgi:CcmD family protein
MAAWLIVTLYVVLLGLRENKLRRELDRVRQMVETHAK